MTPGDPAMTAVLRQLRRRGIGDADCYKATCLHRRVAMRMRARGVDSLAGYARLLARDAGERDRLRETLSVGVTGFFRDPDSWKRLRETLEAEPPHPGAPVFAWSMGCATGEEAWSLTMLLSAVVRGARAGAGFQVLASDVDDRALAIAQLGSYDEVDETAIHGVAPECAAPPGDGPFEVGEELRDRVRFRREDLTRVEPPTDHFDLVCCRNVLIFLSREGQGRVLDRAVKSLRPGGILMLGRTESPGAVEDKLTPIDTGHRLYRKRR